MIYTALGELEKTPVLSPDQAIKIKDYIKNKYHYFTNEEAASIFADAVHKILDNELKIFSKSERQTIKKDILASAVYRDQFFLTGYDVFKGIIHVERSAGDFLILVKEWLRTHFDYNKSAMLTKEIENYIVNFEDYDTTIKKAIRHTEINETTSPLVVEKANHEVNLETYVLDQCVDAVIDMPNEDSLHVKDMLASSYNYALEKVCDRYNSLIESSYTMVKHGENLIKHSKSLVLDKEWREAIWDRASNPIKASIVAIGILAAVQTNMFIESNIHTLKSHMIEDNIITRSDVEYSVESNDVMIPLMMKKSIDYSANMDETAFIKEIIKPEPKPALKSEPKTELKSKAKPELKGNTDGVKSAKNNATAVIPKTGDYVQFSYKSIDEPSLQSYLKKRNSILAEEPYFSTILNAAKTHDINPVILFAITGQEQGFVSKKNSNASVIANNPFNVYGSWKKYNTNIIDSSKIASITLIRLYEGCPSGTDPIKWINRKYAEDKNWHKGVNSIIDEIEAKVFYNN